jgi:hypothetical protein
VVVIVIHVGMDWGPMEWSGFQLDWFGVQSKRLEPGRNHNVLAGRIEKYSGSVRPSHYHSTLSGGFTARKHNVNPSWF